jgi:hypothetical protein
VRYRVPSSACAAATASAEPATPRTVAGAEQLAGSRQGGAAALADDREDGRASAGAQVELSEGPTDRRAVRGQLDRRQLGEAGQHRLVIEPGTLPITDFDSAVQAFLAAFDNAAAEEVLLHPLLQFAEQKRQTALQGEMVKALRRPRPVLSQDLDRLLGVD